MCSVLLEEPCLAALAESLIEKPSARILGAWDLGKLGFRLSYGGRVLVVFGVRAEY